MAPAPNEAKRQEAPAHPSSVPVAAPASSTTRISAPPGSQQRQDVQRAYLAELAAAIEQRKRYPRLSRRRGEEGHTLVNFVIRADGTLEEIRLRESSGHRRLDQAALRTLHEVSPFRPIPPALARERWEISVPIVFRLR